MRNLRTLLFAGAAAVALGLGAAASAKDAPDKSPLASGAQQTQCDIADPAARGDWLALEPRLDASFWKSAPLRADPDAVWAEIDRQMEDVRCRMEALRRMALAPQSDAVFDAETPQTEGRAGRICTRSLEITQYGDEPPKIVRRSSGACPDASGDGADNHPAYQGVVRT